MQYTILASVRLREGRQPLANVLVNLVHVNRVGEIIAITPQRHTNAGGTARLTFRLTDVPGIAIANLPLGTEPLLLPMSQTALYIQVYDEQGTVIQKEPLRPNQGSQLRRVVNVLIPLRIAQKHQILPKKPHPTPESKQQHWTNSWREYFIKAPESRPIIDMCLLQNVFATLKGLENPTNDLQMRARAMIEDQVKPDQWEAITQAGSDGLKLVDAASSKWGLKCPSLDLDDIAKQLTSDDGPLGPVMHMFGNGTNLFEDLGTPKRGAPFTLGYELKKVCMERYNQNDLPGDVYDAIKQLLTDGGKIVRRPSVNQVDIRQVEGQVPMLIRESNLHAKTLIVRDFDTEDGERTVTVNMDVPLDSPECLVMKNDPDASNYQIMTVDVKPGQRVALWGSGFIADKATLRVAVSRWEEQLNEGRLVPASGVLPVPGLSGMQVDVHSFGDSIPADTTPETLNQDLIVFDWPASVADAGLYQVQVEFENQSDFPTAILQNPVTCEISFDKSPVRTKVFYFVVLPAIVPRPVRARATRVECIDETDPESFGFINWFDDIEYIAQGFIQRLGIDATGEPQSTPVGSPTMVRGNQHFWNSGEEWSPNLTVLPSSGFHLLQTTELITLNLQASEVDGPIDRAVLTIIVIAIVAVVIVVLVALIVAIVLAIMLTYGVAAKIIVATLGLMGTVFTALSSAFLPVIVAAVQAIFAVQPAGLLVAGALPTFSGAELMHRLSPVRYHRLLWVQERPPIEVAPGMLMTRTTTIDNQGLTERYRCSIPGAIYALTLNLDLLG